MVILFLLVNVFFKNCVELYSGTHKLFVDFTVILSMWIYCALFEEVLLLGEVLAGRSGISEEGQHDTAVPFWRWCHSSLVHTLASLNLSHILDCILRL